jgi:serine/threonine-protein kinase
MKLDAGGAAPDEAAALEAATTRASDRRRKRAPPLALPSRIDDYELLEEIARGGMGVVWKARQVRLNRVVALKIMRDGAFASPREVRRFQVEAEAAAALKHPGIVTIHETGEHEGVPYFSMEYVEGTSLADVVAPGPLAPRRAARYVAAIARSVDHAHRQGILHRDLKPANVLIDADDSPKVTDFGIAKRLDAATDLTITDLLGTPRYMAPEQAAGREEAVGPATDVYGLGAILYELLTGRTPFEGTTLPELLLQILDQDPVAPRTVRREVPADIDAICLRCLEKEPRRRYASAGELADDLERFLADEPVAARPQRPILMVRQWMARRPILTLTWIVLVLFLASEWGLWLAGAQPDEVYHWFITALLPAWIGVATLMQVLMLRSRHPRLIRQAWAALDVTFVTLVLLLADGPASPLLMAYPILIFASAFRLRRGLVWWVTGSCALSYLVLLGEAWLRRPQFLPQADDMVVVLVSAFVMGLIAAEMVRRMRGLAGLGERD